METMVHNCGKNKKQVEDKKNVGAVEDFQIGWTCVTEEGLLCLMPF